MKIYSFCRFFVVLVFASLMSLTPQSAFAMKRDDPPVPQINMGTMMFAIVLLRTVFLRTVFQYAATQLHSSTEYQNRLPTPILNPSTPSHRFQNIPLTPEGALSFDVGSPSENVVSNGLVLTPNSRGYRGEEATRVVRGRNGDVRPSTSLDSHEVWQNAAYMIWPQRISGPIIDLEGAEVSAEEIQRLALYILEASGSSLSSVFATHRYIGKTAEGKKKKTTIEKRFKGHSRDCNKHPERRVYKAIRRGVQNGTRFCGQVLFVNALPEQVQFIESELIRLFDGTGDYGLNSNIGSSGKKKSGTKRKLNFKIGDLQEHCSEPFEKRFDDGEEDGDSDGEGLDTGNPCLLQIN